MEAVTPETGNILATNNDKDNGPDIGAAAAPLTLQARPLQEVATTKTPVPRTPQRKRRRGGGGDDIVRREADEEEEVVTLSEAMKKDPRWINAWTARHSHGEADLTDHPAAAGDTKECMDSCEDRDRIERVPGVPLAGKDILEETSVQNLHQKAKKRQP